MSRVLICGASTRAAAESAARAGFRVTSIDGYADSDQHAAVHALSLPRDFGWTFTAQGVARAATGIACDAVAYLSPFENHSSAVAALARGRQLWGNPPEVLARVRDPVAVADALRARGFAVPEVRARGTRRRALREQHAAPALGQGAGAAAAAQEGSAGAWMVKPLRSGGGSRVRLWRGEPVARDCYLQRRIDGTPGAVVFAAAHGACTPIGVSRQICGDVAFGADGHRYCGSILAADALGDRADALLERACTLAAAAAEAFGLAGVNGLDFVAAGEVPYPVEINPRWSASMELVERRFGLSVFGVHAAACVSGDLPRFDLLQALRGVRAVGKAILFAREDVVTGDTTPWLEAGVRDVPHSGERIARGQPVCTIFAEAATAGACYDALVRRAESVYADMASWRDAAPARP